MAFLKNLNGIPLFSTIAEAVTWGKQNLRISGFHAHRYAGSQAFMAVATHEEVRIAQQKIFEGSVVPAAQQAPLQANTRQALQQSSAQQTSGTTYTPPASAPRTRTVVRTTPSISTGGGYSGGGSGSGGGGGGY